MEAGQLAEVEGEIYVENIGGIDETTVEFSPGVNVLVGRNATNRTSLLQAFMAACGGSNVSIKGDAEDGYVELSLGDETYTRDLSRGSGTIVTDGDPYLENPELADLFAFLLESNETRRAVTRGEDLRDIIMRPVDIDAIETQIEEYIEERQSLEAELEEIEDVKSELPGLEEEHSRLQTEIEEKQTELEAKEREIETTDEDIEETREEKAELEDKLEELRSTRSTLDEVRYDLETEQESRTALEQERDELESTLQDLPEAPIGEDDIDSTIAQLREEKQAIEAEVSELQSVIGFNEELLEDSNAGLFAGFAEGVDEITDQLLENDDVVCWTCGSEVEQLAIEGTLDQLREVSQDRIQEVNELEDKIADLKKEKRDIEQAQQTRDETETRLREIEGELDRSEDTIASLKDRRATLTDEIEELETAVDALENDDYSDILDLHKEANQLEYEIGRLESNLESVTDRISTIDSRIDNEARVESQLEEVREKITELRTRIDRIEKRAVEEFNDHMETVLELLDYTNLDRIWIERIEQEVREGRRTVEQSVFELHVVRTTQSGTAYEDTLDHLSESEVEVTGLIFGLSGYLAHEVYEQVPFMLLDSLEALDANRIATMVDYFQEFSGYLLVALLPEDARELDADYNRIEEI